MSVKLQVQKLPKFRLVMFALGQLGWSLASWAVSNALSAFFLPPESTGGSLFPVFIFQGTVMGIATVIGLTNMGGRLWDAITDPLIANLSDKNKSRFGRRRLFLAFAAIPTALFGFLVFFPLMSGATPEGQLVNAVWLIITITCFYWFITMYCTPYNALIAELGHTPSERLGISTAISITWALGFVIGNLIWILTPVVQAGFGLETGPQGYAQSFQIVLAVFCFISAILMLLPVIFINEEKYAISVPSDLGMIDSIKSTFSNKHFRWFVASDLPYWVALTFIQQGMLYFFTVLLGLDASFAGTAAIVMFFLSYAFYTPVVILSKKLGKKTILLTGFVFFGLTFTICFFLGWLPMSSAMQAWLVVVLAALPLAIFGILPNAIIGDIADSHAIKTNQFQGGMFYGARTFMMKMGISLSNLIFPSLLLLGRSTDNPWGVRFAALTAVGFCIIGFAAFFMYNEKEVFAILAKEEAITE
jgi:Na+/melibiose symporter-like transporter